MGFSFRYAPMKPFVAIGAAMLVLAGCQSAGNNNASDAGAGVTAPAGAEPIRESELRAFCPPIRLREGTAYFRTYERGGDDDTSRLIYQAAISDVTRACSYSDTAITLNVAVAGRVVPGPKGRTGEIVMPIRIAVVSGDDVLFSQLYRHPVQVQDTAGATQFVFNQQQVTIPATGGTNIVVFAGYDEGPPPRR